MYDPFYSELPAKLRSQILVSWRKIAKNFKNKQTAITARHQATRPVYRSSEFEVSMLYEFINHNYLFYCRSVFHSLFHHVVPGWHSHILSRVIARSVHQQQSSHSLEIRADTWRCVFNIFRVPI